MTIAAAFAIDVPELTMVAVLADSKLTYEDGTSAEIGLKTYDLGARTAVAAAGSGTVGATAAELTRSLVEESRDSQPPVGLWDATRTFAHFAREIHRDLRRDAYQVGAEGLSNEFAIAGFYSDGVPGVASLRLALGTERVEFFRPGREQFGCFVIGAAPAKDLLLAAGGDFGSRTAHYSEPLVAFASAMLYVARHEGELFDSIGGGISIGLCTRKHERFIWPTVQLGTESLYRGFRVPQSDPNELLRLELDTDRIAVLDRRVEDARHGREAAIRLPRTFDCSLDEFIGDAPLHRTPEPPSLRGAALADGHAPDMARRSQ